MVATRSTQQELTQMLEGLAAKHVSAGFGALEEETIHYNTTMYLYSINIYKNNHQRFT